jgi:hypothetical protein
VVDYARHRPEQTLLYQLVEEHYPAFAPLFSAGALRTLPRREAGHLQLQTAVSEGLARLTTDDRDALTEFLLSLTPVDNRVDR